MFSNQIEFATDIATGSETDTGNNEDTDISTIFKV